MSFHYGARSSRILATVHPDLRQVFTLAIEDVDISILCGRRRKVEQDYLCDTGASKLRWPNSKHNVLEVDDLARAVDFAPYPIYWGDLEKFYACAYLLRGIGRGLGVEIRLGADWNGNLVRDQNFNDLGHVELRTP